MLQFDENFIHHYNENSSTIKIEGRDTSIVMSGWYRAQLGDLEKQRDDPLNVVLANGAAGKLLACVGHPQVAIRVAVCLGIISVALGVVGFVLGFIGLCT